MNVVCDLYKPCAAFDDRSLLMVLVSLYFLFSHFGSSDNTKEICFFKLLYYIKQCIFKVKSSIYIVSYTWAGMCLLLVADFSSAHHQILKYFMKYG